jgi:hypothetical protein
VERVKKVNRYEEIEAIQLKAKAEIDGMRAEANSETDSLRQQLRHGLSDSCVCMVVSLAP